MGRPRRVEDRTSRLVRRLVLETTEDLVALDFPAAEGTAAGGWDGIAKARTGSPFIPEGLSLWELTTEKSVNTKANRDFNKRKETPDGSAATEAVYVAVAPRRWRDRRNWAKQKTQLGGWKEVRAYGVDDLETWLESAPVTHAWISELLGFKPHGMQTANAWWAAWSSATAPALSAQVLLAGRDAAGHAVRDALTGTPQITTIAAGSLDEALAFVAASVLAGDPSHDGDIAARLAFVDDVATWRALADHPRPLILVARTAETVAEARTAASHHVIVPLTGTAEADISLEPIDAAVAAQALLDAGLDDRQAEEAAQLGRRSVLALRRHLARKPELHTPLWAAAPVDRAVRGALLAGSWSDDATGDHEQLAALCGKPYDDLREEFARLAAEDDPFLTRVGESWTVVSPFDAWRQLRAHVRPDDLGRFQAAAVSVLLEPDPALDLPPEQRWRASLEGKLRAHSADLRAGLATTIALIGVLGDRIDAGRRATGASLARGLVRQLLTTANDDDSWGPLERHLIASAAIRRRGARCVLGRCAVGRHW